MSGSVGSFRDSAGRPMQTGYRGIRVGRWRCDKRNPPLVVGGAFHCPDCGRPIRERWVAGKNGWPPTYKRFHVGLWSTWTGC